MNDPQIVFSKMPCPKCEAGQCNNPEDCISNMGIYHIDTNEYINDEMFMKIGEVKGVSNFILCGPYEAIMRSGRLFNDNAVKTNIRKVFMNYIKSIRSSPIDSEKTVKNSFLKLPNGSVIKFNSADPDEAASADNMKNSIDGTTSGEGSD